MKCKHSYDGINLICPFGCHGEKDISQVHKPYKKDKIDGPRMFPPGKPDLSIIGQVFGQLTVVEHMNTRVKCLCSCGNSCYKTTSNLSSGKKRGSKSSCGSCHKPKSKLTGNVYGRLTTKEYLGKSKFICECSCGNICEKNITNIKESVNNGNEPMCSVCYDKVKHLPFGK